MNAKIVRRVSTTTLTVRIPTGLKVRMDGLAAIKAVNRSRLAVDALEAYVEDHEEMLARIDQGFRDADAGRVVSHEKVKRYLQSWGKNRRLPAPSCE